MRSIILTALIGAGLSAPAWAANNIDANGDGMISLEEVQAVYPEITAETFSAMDVDQSGALDADEAAAAMDAGLMPKS
ncbi:MAG: hypothetical protein ACK5MY_19250 [Jhaorihella sp.]